MSTNAAPTGSIAPTNDALLVLFLREPECPDCSTGDVSKNGSYERHPDGLDALFEEDQPHNKRKGEDEEGWIVEDDIYTDGGAVLGFLMRQSHSRTLIRAVFGTLTILTLNGS